MGIDVMMVAASDKRLAGQLVARIGNGGTKKYEMTVSTYQMCILMLFNDRVKLNYHELLQHLNVADQDLKSQLIPLC